MNPTLPRFFWNEYRKRRKKAALVTFALFWGTLSILLMLAFGQGMSTQFRVSFSGLGETLIMITAGQASLAFEGLPKGRPIRLYREDIDYLRERIPEILRIVPESYSNWQVSAGGKEVNRGVHGTTAEFALLRTQVPQLGGRFLNADDHRPGEEGRLHRLERSEGPLRDGRSRRETDRHQPRPFHRRRGVEEKAPGFDVSGARRRPNLPPILIVLDDRQPAGASTASTFSRGSPSSPS